MTSDLVKCNWCGFKGTVKKGSAVCPECKEEGFLAWQQVQIFDNLIFMPSRIGKQIPLGMAISRRCPKNRIMGRDKTGIFSPRLRTMAVGL